MTRSLTRLVSMLIVAVSLWLGPPSGLQTGALLAGIAYADEAKAGAAAQTVDDQLASPPHVQEEMALPVEPPTTLPTGQKEPSQPVEAGDIQERGLPPGIVAPGAIQGGTLSTPSRFVAQTENLTKVANAAQLRHKSLTIVVAVPPGLVLTKPVKIRVTFKSSVSGWQSMEDLYNPITGFQKLFNDGEGTRIARQMPMEILLTEQGPGGVGGKNFRWSWSAKLDPLFDVAISPLRFTLIDDCDKIGKSEIFFFWTFPDDRTYHSKYLNMKKNQTVILDQFAWARQEVSAATNLRWPYWWFREDDFIEEGFPKPSSRVDPTVGPETRKLLPDTRTGRISKTIREAEKDCSAAIEFSFTINVLNYPNL
jgi:hypothetical protein